jgi:hypothetical protein
MPNELKLNFPVPGREDLYEDFVESVFRLRDRKCLNEAGANYLIRGASDYKSGGIFYNLGVYNPLLKMTIALVNRAIENRKYPIRVVVTP